MEMKIASGLAQMEYAKVEYAKIVSVHHLNHLYLTNS